MTEEDSQPLTRDIAPFGLRMPAELKERVQAAAKANGRSTNAEILHTLEEAYPEHVFDAAMLARLLQILPGSDPDALKRNLDKVNHSLRRQRLEMVEKDGELIIRKLDASPWPRP